MLFKELRNVLPKYSCLTIHVNSGHKEYEMFTSDEDRMEAFDYMTVELVYCKQGDLRVDLC